MAGRKPKPTETKLRAGERRTERINRDEPKLGPVPESPPDDLQRLDERAVWARLRPMLGAAGVIEAGDTDTLVMLCRLQAEASRTTDGNDLVKLSRELRQLWAVFGMTPVDRARIRAPKTKETVDPLERMLTGPQGLVKAK